METIIPEPLEMRQELPVVLGNIDDKKFRETLLRIDEIIKAGNLDLEIMGYSLKARAVLLAPVIIGLKTRERPCGFSGEPG